MGAWIPEDDPSKNKHCSAEHNVKSKNHTDHIHEYCLDCPWEERIEWNYYEGFEGDDE